MNEKNAYNLIDEPWIPVLRRDGNNRSVSLGDIFADANGTIADLALNPYERISVFRLLLCIAQAATDMQSEREWFATKETIGSASLKYLEKWHDRFFLFGKHAFLQVDCLVKGEKFYDTSRLIIHSAHHFGSPLFSREVDTQSTTPFPSAFLAISLLTYLNFSASGGTPICIWNGTRTRHIGPAASPCRSQSKLFTFLLGPTLLETVWMNLLTAKQMAALSVKKGRPCWEFFFDKCNSVEDEAQYWLGPVDKTSRQAKEPTLLGVLVPLSRFIKLKNSDRKCLICEGFSYPAWRDPSATYYGKREKNGTVKIVPLRVNMNRLPWRNLASILELGTDEGGAVALDHLATLSLRLDANVTFSIWTGGMCSDADQDKGMSIGEWLFTRRMSALRKQALSDYQAAIDLSNKQWFSKGLRRTPDSGLKAAASQYAAVLLVDKASRFSEPAERAYWDILAQPENQKIVLNVDSDNYLENWKKVTRKAAEDAYRRACPAVTARQMEAFAQGFAKLRVPDRKKDKADGSTDSGEPEGDDYV